MTWPPPNIDWYWHDEQAAMTEVIQSDVLEWCKSYSGEPFHALLCDSPYELGFMGKDWDKSGITFKPETWAALAEHLHPGAFLMAFASSRGWHRLAVAMEDAGLRIHPTIWKYWNFGAGFPKATRIDTAVDRAAGAERTEVRFRAQFPDGTRGASYHGMRKTGATGNFKVTGATDTAGGFVPELQPATDLARQWIGHRYGLQAMKPAVEPIIVAQKLYAGKPVDSITKTGAGALNIDQARIGTATSQDASHRASAWSDHQKSKTFHGQKYQDMRNVSVPAKRWPANFCLCHHPACKRIGEKKVKGNKRSGVAKRSDTKDWRFDKHNRGGADHTDPNGTETVAAWDCHPDCPVRRLGEMSGERQTGKPTIGAEPTATDMYNPGWGAGKGKRSLVGGGDTGTAARFFFQADWAAEIQERLFESDPVYYCAKSSRRERDAGLDAMTRKPTDWQRESSGLSQGKNPTTGKRSGRICESPRNFHPTIKPLSLCRWLATLLLPPPAYAPRRLLVPFAGTGSEMIGAMQAGWEEIVGIENDPETMEIARMRLRYWQEEPQQGVLPLEVGM